MLRLPHYFRDVVLLFFSLLLVGYLSHRAWKHWGPKWRPFIAVAALLVSGVLTAGASFSAIRISKDLPNAVVVVGRGGALLLFGWLLVTFATVLLWDAVDRYHPGRRRLLKTATFAAPLVITGAGYAGRDKLRVTNTKVNIPGLPPGLHGLRLVLLSDLHMSMLVPRALVARAVSMANELDAHVALVTGDLITRGGDPLDACLDELARLKAEGGVLGCLGNHEIYSLCEEYTWREGRKRGIQFLRSAQQVVEFGGARLNIAGVDYQRSENPYLTGAEKLMVPGIPNILLSHNPDVFPVAARLGFDLTLSGHTHGGQVNVEILNQHLNVARFYTPYVSGKYEIGTASAYVTRGIGTIGLPVRLNASPEVSLIELCAT